MTFEVLLFYILDPPITDILILTLCLVVQNVLFFREMGVDKKTVGKIFCRSPEIFASNVDNTLKKKIDFFINFGVSEHHLPRIIRKYPELLLLDINCTLLPRYHRDLVQYKM